MNEDSIDPLVMDELNPIERYFGKLMSISDDILSKKKLASSFFMNHLKVAGSFIAISERTFLSS